MKKVRRILTSFLLILCLSLTATPTNMPMSTSVTVLAKTYNSATIKKVQNKLNKLKYKCTTDGIVGKKTRKAIRAYQRDKGFKVTGAINKKLLNSLKVKEVKNSTSTSKTNNRTVYITRTGAKYHRSGCRYLSQSKIPISLSSAKMGYTPCSVCNP